MGRVLARVLAVVLVLVLGGAMLAGVYNAGVSAGLAQAGGAVTPYIGVPYGYGFGFGFFGLFGGLLFLFLIFGLLRFAFGGPRRGWGGGPGGPGGWGGHGHGRWGGWEGRVPPPVEEWHRRLHGDAERTETPDRPATTS